MELIDAIIVIGLSLAGAAYLFDRIAPHAGAGALGAVLRVLVAIVVAVVAVVALWVVFDERDTGTAGASSPTPTALIAGYAGNGNCPPECLAAHHAYRAGVAARAEVTGRP